MAKHVLHNDSNFFDFVLIGIASSENQYVMVNNVNDSLCINLRLDQTLKFTLKEHELFEFSIFHYQDEELALEYYLVPNKSNFKPLNNTKIALDLFAASNQVVEETASLINELPHTNYFLMLKGDNAIHEQYKIFQLLKGLDCVHHVHEVIPDKLPSKNNLVF